MGTEDGKSAGSRWEAWRNPSRSHLAGGSSIQLHACQPPVRQRGEINRSARQSETLRATGSSSQQPPGGPLLRCILLGVRGARGWVVTRRGQALSRFFLLCENAGVRGSASSGAARRGAACSRLQSHSCRGGLAAARRLLLPGKASESVVVCGAGRAQANKKVSAEKPKIAAPGPRQPSASSPPRVGTCGTPEGDAGLTWRLFVPGFSGERREAAGSWPRWLRREEKKWVY